MKCIQCSKDNNLKDRTGNQGRCVQCNHPFAFEPTSMREIQFTDSFFAKAIADISVNNTLFFTPKQLLYLLDKRLKRKSFRNLFTLALSYLFISLFTLGFIGRILSMLSEIVPFPVIFMGCSLLFIFYLYKLSNSLKLSRLVRYWSTTALKILGIVILIFGVLYGISINSIWVYSLVILIIGLIALGLSFIQKQRLDKIPETFLISAAQMENWLNQWMRVNGSVNKLLSLTSTSLQPASPDSDVTAYSFDRLVVCQSDAIAQMLIANNFHFENNCAILSIFGYPQNIFATTMQMLRRNPELQVFAFHDCSPEGLELAHQLRTNPSWFAGSSVVIVDLALLPRQILAAKRDMFVQTSPLSARAAQSLLFDIRQNLTDVELQWLDAGNFVELESFTPQKLIQILNRGIARSQQVGTAEDSSLILVGDGDGYYLAIDSFG